MKIKRFLVGLSATLLVSIGLQSALALASENFSDVSASHPNFTAIMGLKAEGIIGGYPDGSFKPEQVVNRVEALKIVLLGGGINVPESSEKLNFNDVDSTQWYGKYLLKAYNLGIVAGYEDGSFKPNQTVNLVENLKMIINTNGIDLSNVQVSSNPYADALSKEWYAKYVQYAKNKGWLTPDSKNMIYPGQGMTRAKLAQLIYNALQDEDTNPDEEPDTSPAVVQNVTIQGNKFITQNLTVAVGTTVKWTNKDDSIHNVTSDDEGFVSSSGLSKGETYETIFDELGTFTYHCSVHPTMTGSITVKPANEVPTI